MRDEIDSQLKRALHHLSTSVSPEPIEARHMLERKRAQHNRVRGVAAGFIPLITIALFLAVTAFPVFAGEENLYQWWGSRQIESQIRNWNELPLGANAEEELALSLGIPLEEIRALRDSGYGYGEIVLMAQLAQQSGRSISEIQAMREKGLGWGRISSELEVSWQNAAKEMEEKRERVRLRIKEHGSEKLTGPEDNPSAPENGPEEKPVAPGPGPHGLTGQGAPQTEEPKIQEGPGPAGGNPSMPSESPNSAEASSHESLSPSKNEGSQNPPQKTQGLLKESLTSRGRASTDREYPRSSCQKNPTSS